MNTNAPFPAPLRPELSLKRREPGTTTPPMSVTQPPMSFGSPPPFGSAAPFLIFGFTFLIWDKLYRARALLEAEQAHLRDDRIALQGELDALDVRRQAIVAREVRIQQLEMKAALDKEEADEEKGAESTMAKLTRAPFEMARQVFGKKD